MNLFLVFQLSDYLGRFIHALGSNAVCFSKRHRSCFARQAVPCVVLSADFHRSFLDTEIFCQDMQNGMWRRFPQME